MAESLDKAAVAAKAFDRLIEQAREEASKVESVVKMLEEIKKQAEDAADGVTSEHARKLKGMSINLESARQALSGVAVMIHR